ncbi:hypothetical protein [Aneurinibacillus aneurinilyticus]|uniref:Uncharacterized protein n=1 Tax=Aneurinibacillus aneurinilyticus TaxID=1391 RepID=A0A848CUI9_ANEAE|nr:hypothetical protein [Aneurinibacillus aneurinilyticus]MCI1695777.1 hypothetical protein [Aneurinibacillus aneurinilyticus]NME98808.1 hypothetical protein [Aneurinibacillus aneurinilyticus]
MKKALIALLSSIFLVSGLCMDEAIANTEATKVSFAGKVNGDAVTFAYADKTGKHLLAFDLNSSDRPKRFTKVICSPGNVRSVKYVKYQKEGKHSNHRNAASNITQDAGAWFDVVNGKFKENESCLLIEKDAFKGHTFLPHKPVEQGEFSDEIIRKVTEFKKRKVIKQGLIGEISPGVQIGLVEFERKGKNVLASIVMTTPNGLVFKDFPATYDEVSTWRVDDQGEIDPQMFNILFVTKSKTGYTLGLEWIGFEGNSLSVLQQNGNTFYSINQSGRYMAPF